MRQNSRRCGDSIEALRPERPKADITFGAWMDRWYQTECKPAIRPKDQADYENRIYQHIIPELGHIPLVKLNPGDLSSSISGSSREGGSCVQKSTAPASRTAW